MRCRNGVRRVAPSERCQQFHSEPACAAQQERASADCNTHQTEPRVVIVQAGAYGEHQCESVTFNGQTVNDHCVTVRLAPGCGGRLTLLTRRYQNVVRFD